MPALEVRDVIAVLSAALSLFAFFYSLLTNTKRYELRTARRMEILSWYSTTVTIMQELAMRALGGALEYDLKQGLVAKLSAQIEIGRFFFPNIDKKDNFGSKKPSAYRGHRTLALDSLVYYLKLFEKDDYKAHPAHVHSLEQQFTSYVLDVIDVRSHLRESKRVTKRLFTSEMTYGDFIQSKVEESKD